MIKRKVGVFILLSLFGVLIAAKIHGQMVYRDVPVELIPKNVSGNQADGVRQNASSSAYDITLALPKDHVQDGSVDYTTYVQDGINKHSVVSFPNFPVLINKDGLSIRSDMTLLFKQNSKLIMQPNGEDTYEVLRVHNVSNVNIIDANIVGDRSKHLAKTGEWGMGIAIRTSSNVNIYNAKIFGCWGDGIYIGSATGTTNGKRKLLGPSENIKVYNSAIDGCGRNGISIVAARGVDINGSIISNSLWKFPKAGIDIEPASYVEGIKISNTVTFNNGGKGIDLFLKSIVNTATNNVDVVINNYKDYNSAIGLRIAGYKDNIRKAGANYIGGQIVIDNIQFSGNSYSPIVVEANQSYAPKITFSNVRMSGGSSAKMNSLKSSNAASSRVATTGFKDMPQIRKGLATTNNIVFK